MIQQIQKNIAGLFETYKIPALTLNLPIENLQSWAEDISKRLELDPEYFYPKASEFFWALSHVQLAMGYALVARQSCEFPKGKNGTSYDDKSTPDLLDLCDMHFWHHAFYVRECIYRCWERLAAILSAACYPNIKEKLYFDGIVGKIATDLGIDIDLEINNLKKQIKHWNKASSIRNKLSHHESSPFNKININVEFTDLIGFNRKAIPKYHYKTENIVHEIEIMKDAYLKLLPAFIDVTKFINKYSEGRTKRCS